VEGGVLGSLPPVVEFVLGQVGLGLPAERLLLVFPEFEFPLLDRGGHERTLVPILGLCRLQGVLLLLLQGLECW